MVQVVVPQQNIEAIEINRRANIDMVETISTVNAVRKLNDRCSIRLNFSCEGSGLTDSIPDSIKLIQQNTLDEFHMDWMMNFADAKTFVLRCLKLNPRLKVVSYPRKISQAQYREINKYLKNLKNCQIVKTEYVENF